MKGGCYVKIKLSKDHFVWLSVFGAIICFLLVSHLVKSSAATYPIFGSNRFPVPKGSVRSSTEGLEGMELEWLECNFSREDVDQFYEDYFSTLTTVYKKGEPQKTAHFDKERGIVFTELRVNVGFDERTRFIVFREAYDEKSWSLEPPENT